MVLTLVVLTLVVVALTWSGNSCFPVLRGKKGIQKRKDEKVMFVRYLLVINFITQFKNLISLQLNAAHRLQGRHLVYIVCICLLIYGFDIFQIYNFPRRLMVAMVVF